MATATKGKTTKKAAKPAPAPEVDETDEELEELEEDETTEDAPKAKGGAAQQVTFGASDLAKLVSKGRDKPVTAREIRTLIRKMARDGSGRVDREIIAGNRSRYDWSGPNDPEVKAIVKAFNNGELEADKQEKLAALKARKAEKDAAKKAAGETGKKGKKGKKGKAAEVVEED